MTSSSRRRKPPVQCRAPHLAGSQQRPPDLWRRPWLDSEGCVLVARLCRRGGEHPAHLLQVLVEGCQGAILGLHRALHRQEETTVLLESLEQRGEVLEHRAVRLLHSASCGPLKFK